MIRPILMISLTQCLCLAPLSLAGTNGGEQITHKTKVSKTPPEIREELEIKISNFLSELIESSAAETNEYVQMNIKKIADTAKASYAKILKKNLRIDRSAEALEWDFSYLWKEAINRVIERTHQLESSSGADELMRQFDLGDETSASESEETSDAARLEGDAAGDADRIKRNSQGKTLTTKTVLTNILLRQKDGVEKSQKLRTLIEMGADKNLNESFKSTPKMENQKEYPLKVILDEISDEKVRQECINVLFDDRIIYSRNDILPGEKMQSIKLTLETNKSYLAERLLEANDYETFAKLLDKAEELGILYLEDFTDEISQIHDQLYSPLLEKILAKMRDVRRATYSSNRHGERVDNIKEFLTSKRMAKQMQLNSEARFSLFFQNRLKKDYESLFAKIAQHIDETRVNSDLLGKEFRTNLLKWISLANFRNRICKHLNKFALSASNNAKKSNVIRLIRLANTFDQDSLGTDEGDKFRELEEFGGKQIIFGTKNKLKWTPSMYAMAQKQSEGIQLLLKQAINRVNDVDGVGNNIFHLAFPLPEQFFKGELTTDSGNILELIGSHLGSADARSKTTEAIKAITLERGIPTDDKIAAMTTASASNFTPLALAASIGNLETYEFMRDFLIQNNAWNEDDHAYLGTHIDELLVQGMKAYLNSKSLQKSISAAERSRIASIIAQRSEELRKKYEYCIHEIYQPEVESTVERLEKIEAAATDLVKEFYARPATKRKVDPYKPALKAAMEKMTASHRFWSFSSLIGMKEATSMVKASYLAPVVRKMTKDFLTHNPTPKDMTFDKVYEGLTGSVEKTFFAEHFNKTVEFHMHKVIRDAIIAEGRLREDAVEEDANNRFKNVEEEYLSDNDESSDDSSDAGSVESQVHDAGKGNLDQGKEWAF